MKKRFKMTQEQLDTLLNACKPVTYMVVGGVPPRSPQENANDAWERLGVEMGFIWDTVSPVDGEDMSVFMAEPRAADPVAPPIQR
jgi:hypothetical protein